MVASVIVPGTSRAIYHMWTAPASQEDLDIV
jgi:hypothetical protein